MYTKELLKERINMMAKKNGGTVKEMLLKLGLNENTVNQISDKKGISSFSLAMIADYLDCSVDYLLGRTDEPKPEAETKAHIEQRHIVLNANSPIEYGLHEKQLQLDEMQTELLSRFAELPFTEKLEVMQDIVNRRPNA